MKKSIFYVILTFLIYQIGQEDETVTILETTVFLRSYGLRPHVILI